MLYYKRSKEQKGNDKMKKFAISIVALVLAFAVLPAFTMLAYYTVADSFGWPHLTYWQFVVVVWFLKIAFGTKVSPNMSDEMEEEEMAKVVVGGYVWQERIMPVPDDFEPIIQKAKTGENFTDDEWNKVHNAADDGAVFLRATECLYITTMDGDIILDN